ncbi:MAG: RNA-binding protein [Acidimicrobiia bacterium]|nr:RNA-binding protein [Acidimicrobiia bacterium]
MSTNVYVGNLSFSTDSAALRALFAPHGEVSSAQVVQDRETGRSRGFGFVEMTSADEAQQAIAALNGTNLDGRQLTISLARARAK